MSTYALYAALILISAHAYYPGIAPQCLPDYQCTFYRSINSNLYSFDLTSLCARQPGAEYTAKAEGSSNDFPQIKFNVCGTVSKIVGLLNYDKSAQLLPMPRSRGVATFFIDDPNQPISVLNPNMVSVVDVDTCDQATNPACAFDNYPTPPNPGAVEVNAQRQAMCAANPNYYYCKPNRSPYYATENAEVLATYDGGSPAYSLVDELDPDSGVVVTFSGAIPWAQDPFKCSSFTDPATGLTAQRKVSLIINCDRNATGLVVSSYTEPFVCEYHITARSQAACGIFNGKAADV